MNEIQGWVGWMKSVLEDQMYKCIFENKQWGKINYSLMLVPVDQAKWNYGFCYQFSLG